MTKYIPNLKTKLYWAKLGFFVLYALLIALISSWNILREDEILWMVWAIQCLPLIIFLPGLYQQYYRSYSWFCFLLLLYFVVAVESSFKSNAGLFDYSFLALTSVLFVFSMMSSRWLQYSLYQDTDKKENEETVS